MTQPPPDIHLDEEFVQPVLDGLATDRSDLDTVWFPAQAAIRAGESAFGPSDRLNRAFHPGYTPRAEQLRPAAGRRVAQYGELFAAGRDSVEIYRRGDGNSAIPFLDIN